MTKSVVNEACDDPICKECAQHISCQRSFSASGCINRWHDDMYAPTELDTGNVTVMDMLCASVCITSVIYFTFEKTYQGCRAVDEHAQGNTHRMAARGNATSFPLPWQDL